MYTGRSLNAVVLHQSTSSFDKRFSSSHVEISFHGKGVNLVFFTESDSAELPLN